MTLLSTFVFITVLYDDSVNMVHHIQESFEDGRHLGGGDRDNNMMQRSTFSMTDMAVAASWSRPAFTVQVKHVSFSFMET